jgi:hypothetical protein
VSATPPPDLAAIRSVLSRATGTGWEAAYRQDVGALLDEVERLRAYVGDLKRHGASLHKAAAAGRDAERAAMVAFVHARIGMYDGELRSDEAVVRALQYLADEIERGDHRREEEK